MQWPRFEPAELFNMLISGFLGFVSGWVIAYRSYQLARKQQREQWTYDYLIQARDEAIRELEDMERHKFIPPLISGRAARGVPMPESTGEEISESQKRLTELGKAHFAESEKRITELRNKIASFDEEIEKFRKG